MITQFLIDCLKNDEPFAWFEIQTELWKQDPSPENYGRALEAWVEAEKKQAEKLEVF